MISFLDTTIENPSSMESILHRDSYSLSCLFSDLQNQSFLKVMRSILPTDLVSFATFKEKIKPDPRSFQQNTNDRFSENILLL
jgi:hypothetical protein